MLGAVLPALISLLPSSLGRCVSLEAPEIKARLSVSPALSREIVLVPPVMSDGDAKALALALHADIERDGDRLRLLRRASTRHALEGAERDWLKVQVDATLARAHDRFRADGASQPGAPFAALRAANKRVALLNDRIDTSASEAQRLTPVARLLADLLRGMSSRDLSAAAPGTLTVYSSAPVGSERPLVLATKAMEVYSVAQREFASRTEAAIAQGAIADGYRWAFPDGAFRPGPRTFRLEIDQREAEPAFSLSVYDSAGHRESSATLLPQDGEARATAGRGGVRLGKVELGPPTRAGSEEATRGSGWLDPLVHEPLDFVVRDALLARGKAKGYDRVVACVPDRLLKDIEPCLAGTTLDLDVLSEALERCECESLAAGRTLVIRPIRPLQEEALRIDRRPLSTLYRRASQGAFGLDDLLDYHAALADGYEHRPIELMEGPIRRAFRLASDTWSLPHPLLAILGGFSPGERRSLIAGERMSLADSRFVSGLLALAERASWSVPFVALPPGARIVYSAPSFTGPGSDLERTPARLVAARGGVWLQAGVSKLSTFVRAVPTEYAKSQRRLAPSSPESPNENVNPAEQRFVARGFFTSDLSDAKNDFMRRIARKNIDDNYRFLWLQEHTTPVEVHFGNAAQFGPSLLRARGEASKVPVPLDQVP